MRLMGRSILSAAARWGYPDPVSRAFHGLLVPTPM